MKENEQLRKHLKRRLIHKYRSWRYKGILKYCGDNVYFDKNVELMRYPMNIAVSDNVVIKEGARICSCNENATISIGKNTTIGYQTFLFASEKIEIGDDCLIAPFVYLVDSDHNFEKDIKINQQGNSTAMISVKNDVWIGTGAKILKGVSIGEGAVISAGAVVKDDVEAYTIVGGIPARKIGERK